MGHRLAIAAVVASITSTVAAAELDPRLNSLSYRLVGPYRGGRVTAVAGVPGDPMTYYMGSTGGGVWKTRDAGATWFNVSDAVRELEPQPEPSVMGDVDARLAELGLIREPPHGLPDSPVWTRRAGDAFGTASIGAIAVAPSDPNVVFVGTGSACPRGNISPGDGIYASLDAGDTWRHVGLPEAGQIGRILIHPWDPEIVYVAVLGNIFGPSSERGVYRTVDGGLSWSRVLFVSEDAGAVDLAMDPSNPRVLYAATWQARRSPWNMVSGGPGSGLYKTTDGGNTWVELTDGLPEGVKGRIAVAVSPAAPSRVWALVEHEDEGGLYRSDNGGEKFRRVSSNRELIQRAWYYTHIEADPQDPDTMYVLNVMFWRSIDGGATFKPVPTPHGDNHALWINPDDPKNMIEGNDGGANVTFNGGRTWSTQANQPTAEMYRVTIDDQHPYWLYGGQQDNSAVAIPSRSPGGIAREDWYEPAGCESATVAVDPRDPDITYGGCYGGSISRYDRALEHAEEVMAWPQMAVGRQASDLRYRFQWNAPIRISPHDPSVLYHCANVVLRSTDEGRTWTEISPDLTRDDESKQGYAGEPITRDNTGVEVFGTIFAFEESPARAGLLWAGSDDGLVHVSEDGGATWRDVTPSQMPEWGTVNLIELSAHDPRRAFIAVHRYRQNDFRPYIFRTDDLGASWRLLTDGNNGIPADHFVRAVREDPQRRGLLYAGTEFGMYVSFDDGRSWRSLQLNLPVTPVTDLAVTRGDLVVATQGRSYWILDDLSVLRQLQEGLGTEAPHLFAPRPAVRWVDGSGGGGRGAVGHNPPFGAVIHYLLPEAMDGDQAAELRLEILDAGGEVLRSLSSKEAERQAPSPWRQFFPELAEPPLLDARAGANRYVWGLTLGDADLVDDAVLWGWPGGPTVPPGAYQARLTVGDWSETADFQVVADPRLDVPQEAFEAQYELARSVWQALNRSHDLIRSIRDVRSQAQDLAERMDDEAVDEAAQSIAESLTSIEERIHQTRAESSQDILNFTPRLDNQLLYLQGIVESTVGAPLPSSRERFAELAAELDGLERELDAVIENKLPELESLLDARGAPRVMVRVDEESPAARPGPG